MQTQAWFRLVCLVLAAEQLLLAGFGWWLQGYSPPPEMADSKASLETSGRLLVLLGCIFVWPNLVLAFSKAKPWVWVAGLTNLAASILCCPPGALLLFPWLRRDVKAFYGMPE